MNQTLLLAISLLVTVVSCLPKPEETTPIPATTTTTTIAIGTPLPANTTELADHFLKAESVHNLIKDCDPNEDFIRLLNHVSKQPPSNYRTLEKFLESLKNSEPIEQRPLNETTELRQQHELDSEYEKEEQNEIDMQRGEVASPGSAKPIKAAVMTRYSMEYRPISEQDLLQYSEEMFERPRPMQPVPSERVIEVIPNTRPLAIHFKSLSSQIRVRQSMMKSVEQKQAEHSSSQEEPRKYVHQIRKPIIQEVHEIIMPFRKVFQEIQPVVEEIHTIVSANKQQGSENKFNQQLDQQRPRLIPQRKPEISADYKGLKLIDQSSDSNPASRIQYPDVRSRKYRRNVLINPPPTANNNNYFH